MNMYVKAAYLIRSSKCDLVLAPKLQDFYVVHLAYRVQNLMAAERQHFNYFTHSNDKQLDDRALRCKPSGCGFASYSYRFCWISLSNIINP